MKTEFIPYGQALDLKELGFDEPCFMYYTDKGELYKSNLYGISAPLYQQAFRWFREKYGLVGWVEGNEGKKIFMYRIESPIDSDDQLNCYPFRTYEEAELACLKKLIEIVKTKEK